MRPALPIPVGAIAARIVDSVAMRPGSAAIIESMARGVADQEAMIVMLDAAEAQGKPLPLAVAESFRFAAQKNAGLAAFLLKRALDDARRPIASPVAPPSPCPQPGEARDGGNQ